MLKVADHDFRVPVYLHILDRFVRCELILEWLIRHRFTGPKFVEFIKTAHMNSALRLGAWVLQTVDKEKEAKPVILGRDFRPAS